MNANCSMYSTTRSILRVCAQNESVFMLPCLIQYSVEGWSSLATNLHPVADLLTWH